LKAGRLVDGQRMIQQYQSLLVTRSDMIEVVYQELVYRLIQTNAYQEAWNILQGIKKDFGQTSWYAQVSLFGLDSLGKKLAREWKAYPEGENLLLAWYRDLSGPQRNAMIENYYLVIAMEYRSAGLIQKATEILQKGLEIVPSSRMVRQGMAAVLTDRGNAASSFKEKLSWYKQALTYDPENWELDRVVLLTYRSLVEEYANQEDWKNVLAYAEEGLGRYAADRQLQYYRDYARRKLTKQ